MKKLSSLTILLILIINLLFAQEGDLIGYVIDRETRTPLPGVNVLVEGTDFGAATDENGKYVIKNLPAGTYNLKFQMIGYQTVEKLQVPLNPDRTNRMDIQMAPSFVEGDAVVVTGKTFTKPIEATVSSMNLDFPEMMNDAGSAMDIQRMMQALPSVVSGSDQNNEIIVRGGNRGENLFLMDNIEIPNPNHFGWQGTGGGPISMMDPLFVKEVDFYAGAFPARFGGKASSVMNIKCKEGSREHFHSRVDMGMSGMGLNINGPLNDGQGSYMFSGHKSFLDLILHGIGMTALPKYSNFHGKVVYDLNSNHKLTWNGMYGISDIDIGGDDEESGVEETELVDYSSSTYATGLTLRSIYSKNSYSRLTLSKVGKNWDVGVEERKPGVADRPVYSAKNFEGEWVLKGDYFKRLNENNNFRVGFNLKAIQFNADEWVEADTAWNYYYHTAGNPNDTVDYHSINYNKNEYDYAKNGLAFQYPENHIKKDGFSYKPSIFAQYKYKPFNQLELNAGLRFSYFEYSEESYVSPRFGLTYKVTPATSINFGYGKHYQEPPYELFTANIAENKSLKSYSSEQFVLGLEHFFTESMKASIELYHKDYDNFPVRRQWIENDSLNDFDDQYVSQQQGRSQGFEIFLQQKKVANFHYSLAYSHYVSEYKDLRKPGHPWYTGSFDFRDVVTFISGYSIDMRQKKWYRNLDDKKWWKYIEWLASPGDEFEIGMRYKYNRGRPYTKQNYDPYLRDWYTSWDTEINGKRMPDYHRLDIMIERRWIFKKSSFVTYLNLMNTYNRHNVWNYAYDSDGDREKVYQYLFTPVGGFIWEF